MSAEDRFVANHANTSSLSTVGQKAGRFHQLSCCCFLLLSLLLNSCATTNKDSTLVSEIDIRLQAIPDSNIPQFVAVTHINASLPEVMTYLMDFASWPSWVYGCQQAQVLQMIGYQEAYVYQATSLPIVRDRDVIIHARLSTTNDGNTITIVFEAAPDYCLNNQRTSCKAVKNSKLVGIRKLAGQFVLQRIAANETKLTWEQHMEPGGMIPDWATRMMLPGVPERSLKQLQQILAR